MPAEIAWIAAVVLDANGVAVSTSPLVPRTTPLAHPAPIEPPSRLLAVGFTAESIAEAVGPGDHVRSVPLAVGCTHPLPPPSWIAEQHDAEWVPSRRFPSLSWTEGPDEELPPALDAALIDVACTGQRLCESAASTVPGGVVLDLSECRQAGFDVRVTQEGGLCVPESQAFEGCDRSPGSLPGELRIECGATACVTRVLPHRAAPWDRRLARVVDVEPIVPKCLLSSGPFSLDHWRAGFLSDLILLDGGRELIVVSFDGSPLWIACEAEEPGMIRMCNQVDSRDAPKSRLHFYDRDLQLSRTATAPPCLAELLPDVAGDGFHALYRDGPGFEGGEPRDCLDTARYCGRGPALRLGHFDRRGRLEASVALPRLERVSPDVYATDLLRSGPWLVAVVDADTDSTDSHLVQLVVFRESDLTQASEADIFSKMETGRAAVLPNGDVTIGDEQRDRITVLQMRDGDLVPAREILSIPGDPVMVHALQPPAAGGAELVALGLEGEISLCDREIRLSEHRFFQVPSAPVSFVQTEADGAFLGLVYHPTAGMPAWRGHLVRFDLDQRAFLPEVLDLGHGPPTRMIAAEDGLVYGLLPWSGEVFRVDPRP
ncbi:MAG: hypothetical protein IT384_04660 [Deltaproteobacteria bacterium]|nr:hypothetical protein [Deltaproteobacteria bacterium]